MALAVEVLKPDVDDKWTLTHDGSYLSLAGAEPGCCCYCLEASDIRLNTPFRLVLLTAAKIGCVLQQR